MTNNLIWQQNNQEPDNVNNLDEIAQWWSNLAGQTITWQQRLIPSSGDLQELDWEPQKFDEQFSLDSSQLRGITLYWRPNQASEERNITPSKLQLNLTEQKLYVFPQSQSQVLIRISLPRIIYQKLKLSNPQLAATIKDGQGIILLRDELQKLEITVTLNQESREQLLKHLKTTDNQ
ncbi:MAG: hypothetical protein AAF298_00445 [Cyanobacteria bacterium P01_A01_bin.40]